MRSDALLLAALMALSAEALARGKHRDQLDDKVRIPAIVSAEIGAS